VKPERERTDEPLLLTPGPLTTSRATREAMLRDWGSRDEAFLALSERVRKRLLEIAGAGQEHACVLLQGSGTFALEAAVGTLVPRDGKLLILANGTYGRRMARICERLGRPFALHETPEEQPLDPAAVAGRLDADATAGHVAVVHCETTSGVANPLEAIATAVARSGRRLIVDAMSSFGALPLSASETPCEAIVASANKCLEGVPGVAFVIARQEALRASEGNAASLALDLHDQWSALEANGQWRFTPPTHVMAALDHALAEHAAEGGVAGRGARYAASCRRLVGGMRKLGFETLLPDAWQAPIIVTFHAPEDPRFAFGAFYQGMRRRGFVIYPGKLTRAPSFRIGVIGHLDEHDVARALEAVAEVVAELGLERCGRAPEGAP